MISTGEVLGFIFAAVVALVIILDILFGPPDRGDGCTM